MNTNTKMNVKSSSLFAAVIAVAAMCFSLLSNTAQAADTKDELFQALGGQAGLTKIVDDFLPLVLADDRIKSFFTKVDQVKLKAMLVDQFCELAGGPCKYKGRDMYETHDGMGVRNAHFNALAEDLQIAMENNHVATSVSNQLVAKLAPMQRPIVSN